MLPEVVLSRDIEADEAEALMKKCPVKVFNIEDIGKGKKRATVARPRACTLCREYIREEGWDKNIALRRVNNHFICKYSNIRVFTWLSTVCRDVQSSWYPFNRIIFVSLSPVIIYFLVSLNSSLLSFNFGLGLSS